MNLGLRVAREDWKRPPPTTRARKIADPLGSGRQASSPGPSGRLTLPLDQWCEPLDGRRDGRERRADARMSRPTELRRGVLKETPSRVGGGWQHVLRSPRQHAPDEP